MGGLFYILTISIIDYAQIKSCPKLAALTSATAVTSRLPANARKRQHSRRAGPSQTPIDPSSAKTIVNKNCWVIVATVRSEAVTRKISGLPVRCPPIVSYRSTPLGGEGTAPCKRKWAKCTVWANFTLQRSPGLPSRRHQLPHLSCAPFPPPLSTPPSFASSSNRAARKVGHAPVAISRMHPHLPGNFV